MNEVMRWLKAFNCEVIEQEQQLFCKLVIEVPKTRMNELNEILTDIRGVEIKTLTT